MMAETTGKEEKRGDSPTEDARAGSQGFGPRILTKSPSGTQPELAKLEASRCLQCKKPACVKGCPVSIDIPSFHLDDSPG